MKHNGHSPQAGERGVSLLELLITVAIVGIIASVAIPSYRQHMMRSNRADATSALLNIAGEQEKFFLQNNAYTDVLGDGGLGMGTHSNNGLYKLTITLDDGGAGFTATASNQEPAVDASGSQKDDEDCETFTLDETGARGSTPEDSSICW